ncbi:MAG TPA: hypothetical protein VGB97_00900 [Candidatus Paceibacterota bacterium]|jgi:uncharacterized membrane protein YbaN (DUF454 family)
MAKFSIKQAGRELKGNAKTPKRIFLVFIALLLIIIGIVSTPLPGFPSRITMLIGLVLLSISSPSVYAWVKRRTQKYPRIQSFADRFRNRVINFIYPSR